LPDEAKELVELLKGTTLPPFQFDEARLPDLVRFVRENAAKRNPKLAEIGFLVVDGLPEGKPQAPDAPVGGEPSAPGAPGAPGAAATAPDAVATEPPKSTVSFQAEGMSAWDILTTGTGIFGYRLDVDAKMVRLLSPRVPDGPLYRRAYRVLPTLAERMVCFGAERSGTAEPGDPFAIRGGHQHSGSTDYEQFFKDFGVHWPDGSSVQYLPTVGKLIIVNTLENHRILRTVLSVLDVSPLQIEIDCQFVALPRAAVEKAASSGRVSSAAVLSLVRDGKGMLLSSPKVVTRNGVEATIKGVVEIIYPTEFTVGGSGSAATNAPPSTGGTAVTPGGFETREVGVILQVVPDVTPDGNMINLTLAPQVVYPPEWQDHAAQVAGAKGGDAARTAPMPQPFFPVESIATTVQVYNGTTLVVGGGVPSQDGKTFTYMLLSATRIDPAGKEADIDRDQDTLEPVETPGG